jgi:hypothetical protein
MAGRVLGAAIWHTPEGRLASEEIDERFSAWADEVRNSPGFYFGEIFLTPRFFGS